MKAEPAYQRALRWLYGLESRGVKLGLERMQAASRARGDAHRDLCIVHIAGTNGKGSVAAMLEHCLRGAGYRTGQFSSPHLHRYTERILINGRPLSEAETARRLFELRDDRRLDQLSFFEYTTVLAFEAFRDAACDVVLLEVGLGGRLDSTNVVTPKVSVITSIGLEHQHVLGDTLAKIAREKAGILKSGVPCVVGARGPGSRRAIHQVAKRVGAPVFAIDRDFGHTMADGGLLLHFKGQRLAPVQLGLAGAHQHDNAACVFAALQLLRREGFALDDSTILRGLKKTRWAGRLEFLAGSPAMLFDSAHNADGCRRLAQHLRALPRGGRRVLLFGTLKDKDHRAMLRAFDHVVDRRVYLAPKVKRARSLAALKEYRPGTTAGSVETALATARRLAGPDGLVVVAGSIYLLSAVRAAVLGVRTDPPIAM